MGEEGPEQPSIRAWLGLSGRQQQTVAAALTLFSAVVILAALGLLAYGLAVFASAFSNVLLPIVVAGVLALILKPYFTWWAKKSWVNPVVAVLLVFATVTLPVAAFIWFFGALLSEQLSELVARAPEYWIGVKAWGGARLPGILDFWEQHGLQQKLQAALQEHAGFVAQTVQAVMSASANVFRAVTGLFGWFVLPVYIAFFLMAEPVKKEQLEGLLPFLKQETRTDIIYLVDQFVKIVVAFFRGQLVIALLQGILFSIGFVIAGLQYGFTLGLLLGLLNIIPYLGSMMGLAITLPLAFFQPDGGLTLLVFVVAVFILVQLIEGYALTPRIMGEQTGLHPLAIMIAIFFWGSALGGITGMLLAIPLTAFLVIFWRLAKAKYITEII